MLTHFQKIILLVCCFSLTACSVLGPVRGGPKNRYRINTVPAVHQSHQSGQTLLVTTPVTLPAFNTEEMAYTTYPHQIAYFANNSWSDPVPNMLQALMIQTLQKTHHYRAVVAPQFLGHYDLILNSELVELQQDFTHRPSVVHLVFNVQLVSGLTNQVIASKLFSIDEVAPRNDPYSGVLAANHAAAQLMRDVSAFCVRR